MDEEEWKRNFFAKFSTITCKQDNYVHASGKKNHRQIYEDIQ